VIHPQPITDLSPGEPNVDYAGLLRTRDAAGQVGVSPQKFRRLARDTGLMPAATRRVYRGGVVVVEYMWTKEDVALVQALDVAWRRAPGASRRVP
jgi:hypothetical protein